MIDQLIQSIPTDMYIGGGWTPSSDGEQFDVRNPATEAVIASVANGTAVDAVSSAGPNWANRSPRDRSEILRKAYDLMVDRREDYATVISLEEGKTRAEGLGEADYAAGFFRWYAEEAGRIITLFPAQELFVANKY